MKSLWNDADRQGLVDRLRRLRPDVPPRWGRFSAPGMVVHLIEAGCRQSTPGQRGPLAAELARLQPRKSTAAAGVG
jgi:hypothetical protein